MDSTATKSNISTLVRVYLKSIRYSGDNIGRQLTIDLRLAGQTHSWNFWLKNGQVRVFGKEVYQAIVQRNLQLPIDVSLTERDAVFDDTGHRSFTTELDASDDHKENLIVEVPVIGSGGDRKCVAYFKLEFEFIKLRTIRYVTDHLPYGWLKVLFEGKTDPVPLPQGLKVSLMKIENGREYFRILEGLFKGQNASVKVRLDSMSYLRDDIQHLEPIDLTLDLNKLLLNIPGLGNFKIVMDSINKIPKGIYDLEIPDDPKSYGAIHMRHSRFARSWFRIGNKGDRYLHVGGQSKGCITIVEKIKWTEIYSHIIYRRKDDRSVGRVIVR